MAKKLFYFVLSLWVIGPVAFLGYWQFVLKPKNASLAYEIDPGVCYIFHNKCDHSKSGNIIKTNCKGIEEEIGRVSSLPSDATLEEEYEGVLKYFSSEKGAYFYSVDNGKFYFRHQNLDKNDPKFVSNIVGSCSMWSNVNFLNNE